MLLRLCPRCGTSMQFRVDEHGRHFRCWECLYLVRLAPVLLVGYHRR